MRQSESGTAFRLRHQKVAFAPCVTHKRHGKLFSIRVDGGIGYLRKTLFEPVEKRLGIRRQTGQRLIRTHGADRLLSIFRHGYEDALLPDRIAPRMAEPTLQRREFRRLGSRAAIEMFQTYAVLLEPSPPGLRTYDLPLYLGIRSEAMPGHIGQYHAARAKLSVLNDGILRDIDDAAFRAENDKPVSVHAPAAGPQAVTVEHGPDLAPAVCKNKAGRAVPRFHERRVIFVESAFIVPHDERRAEGFGDHHHESVGEAVSGPYKKFQNIVQRTGI